MIVKSRYDYRLAELQGLIDLGMHRNGMKYHKDVAEAVYMTEATFSRKFRNPETFSFGELLAIMDALHIPAEERSRVF